jgi:hypothetical protein
MYLRVWGIHDHYFGPAHDGRQMLQLLAGRELPDCRHLPVLRVHNLALLHVQRPYPRQRCPPHKQQLNDKPLSKTTEKLPSTMTQILKLAHPLNLASDFNHEQPSRL